MKGMHIEVPMQHTKHMCSNNTWQILQENVACQQACQASILLVRLTRVDVFALQKQDNAKSNQDHKQANPFLFGYSRSKEARFSQKLNSPDYGMRILAGQLQLPETDNWTLCTRRDKLNNAGWMYNTIPLKDGRSNTRSTISTATPLISLKRLALVIIARPVPINHPLREVSSNSATNCNPLLVKTRTSKSCIGMYRLKEMQWAKSLQGNPSVSFLGCKIQTRRNRQVAATSPYPEVMLKKYSRELACWDDNVVPLVTPTHHPPAPSGLSTATDTATISPLSTCPLQAKTPGTNTWEIRHKPSTHFKLSMFWEQMWLWDRKNVCAMQNHNVMDDENLECLLHYMGPSQDCFSTLAAHNHFLQATFIIFFSNFVVDIAGTFPSH